MAKFLWTSQVVKARRCRVEGGCSCTKAPGSRVTCLRTHWRVQDVHAKVWSGVFWASLRKITEKLLVRLNHSYFSVANMQMLF